MLNLKNKVSLSRVGTSILDILVPTDRIFVLADTTLTNKYLFLHMKSPKVLCDFTPKPINWHCIDLISYHHYDNDNIELIDKYKDALIGNCCYKHKCQRYLRALSKQYKQFEFSF